MGGVAFFISEVLYCYFYVTGSINLVCVPLGCLGSGLLTNKLGRKRAMMVVNVPLVIAWIVLHFASSPPALYCALALTGFTGGLLEAPVLTYVAEITTPLMRGILSSTSSMCVIVGINSQVSEVIIGIVPTPRYNNLTIEVLMYCVYSYIKFLSLIKNMKTFIFVKEKFVSFAHFPIILGYQP
jgi:MFS family permease